MRTLFQVDCLVLGHIGHAYFRLPHARSVWDSDRSDCEFEFLFYRSYIHELIDSRELSPFKQYLERVVKTLFGDNFNSKE